MPTDATSLIWTPSPDDEIQCEVCRRFFIRRMLTPNNRCVGCDGNWHKWSDVQLVVRREMHLMRFLRGKKSVLRSNVLRRLQGHLDAASLNEIVARWLLAGVVQQNVKPPRLGGTRYRLSDPALRNPENATPIELPPRPLDTTAAAGHNPLGGNEDANSQ